MRRVDAAVGRRIEKQLSSAQAPNDTRPPTKLYELRVAMGLVSQLNANDLGLHRDKTLAEADPDARAAIAPRKAALEKKISDIVADRDVSFILENARILGLMDVLGNGYYREIEKFANYLSSDKFWDELAAMPASKRTAVVEHEMLKLVSLDSKKVHEVAAAMLAKQIERDPGSAWENMTPEQRTAGFDGVLLLLANMIERDRGSESSGMQQRIADAKKGGKFASTGKKVAQVLRNAQTRGRIAAALGKKIPHRSFYSAMASDNPELLVKDATGLTEAEREAAGEAMKWAKKYGWVGRGVSVMTSMLTLAGLVASWPPTDANGNVQWSEVGGALSFIGSLPTTVEFAKKDVGGLILKALNKEVAPAARAATSAAATTSKMARAGAFLKGACKIIGPIGDAIFVVVNISEALNEIKNEDAIGTYSRIGQAIGGAIGLVGSILLLSSSAALTGIGMPLALIGAAVALIAAVIDWGWGKSKGAGQAMRQLRELGISGQEEGAFNRLATSTRTVTRGYGAVYYGGTYTATERYRLSPAKVRERAKKASTAEKVGMINQFLEENTSAAEESLVYEVLRETPYDRGEFLTLMESLDGRLLASELENDAQAANVMMWTAQAYHYAGKPPGKAFLEQLEQHGQEHHEGAINKFLDKLVAKGANNKTLDLSIYRAIDPAALCEASKKLLFGSTNRSEAETVVRMLDKTSWAQFNGVMEQGHLWYVRRLRSQLGTRLFRKVKAMMEAPETSETVKKLAKEQSILKGLTTERKTIDAYDEFGGSYRYTSDFKVGNDRIRERAKAANRFEKVVLITNYLNNPNRREEQLIYHVLRETPYTGGEFLHVIEALPAARVARALENDAEAANVMMWTLQAYHNAGKKPPTAFYEQLEAHCRYQRPLAVNKFVLKVVKTGADHTNIARSIYNELDAKKLVEASLMFDFDETSKNEGVVMFNMLTRTSYTQFNQMVELGHLRYVQLLKKVLSTELWHKVHGWMTAPAASPAVKHLALQVLR